MSEVIIKVENVSKLYKLGSIGTGTLSHDLNNWWNRKRGKPDPFFDALGNPADDGNSEDHIWSLRDINFEIKRGEIFGIIGKNGAGKSTLLKLLSKISKPSSGKIHIDGRIASLLEVGTGFHPDLTGRENVFLNGAILGMSKMEITKKFDEIINFSGVERFIDTPVKRYSSGMYVRLAFAVAAHLEPEILIIDEVLAVGDAEFQQKCLGKIKDVSFNHGRTILFVSHSIVAVKSLCSKVLLLEKGREKAIGSVESVLRVYEEKISDKESGLRGEFPDKTLGYFMEWKLETDDVEKMNHACYPRDNCTFTFAFRAKEFLDRCEIRFMLSSNKEVIIYVSSLANRGNVFSLMPGQYNLKLSMQLPIEYGTYCVEVGFICNGQLIDLWNSSTLLTVLNDHERYMEGGVLNIPTSFTLEQQPMARSGNLNLTT